MKFDFKPGEGEEIKEELKPFSPRTLSRRVALQALYQWQLNASSMHDITKQFNEKNRLDGADLDLYNDLVNGVTNSADLLDELYGEYLDRKISLINPVEKTILRIGTFELKNSVSIPYKAVINEAVELAKSFGAEDGHKYINGILDKLAKSLRAVEIQG